MGTDNLFWKKKNRSLKRKSRQRGRPPKSFLIVCEGQKTEPNYFNSFRLSSATVKVIGAGDNTVNLVRKALAIRDRARINEEIYDQVWCVFDRDGFTLENFSEAITFAVGQGIKVAYSNEAFELWYLLHFHYYQTAMSRRQYIEKLSQLLNHPYKKNHPSMYRELLNKQKEAIKNAQRLLNRYNPPNPGKDDPSTTVHQLVTELNKYCNR